MRVRSVASDAEASRTVAHQAPLSMGITRQEYWSGLPFLPQGIFPTKGSNQRSLVSPALTQKDSLPLAPPGKPYTYTILSPKVCSGLIHSSSLLVVCILWVWTNVKWHVPLCPENPLCSAFSSLSTAWPPNFWQLLIFFLLLLLFYLFTYFLNINLFILIGG